MATTTERLAFVVSLDNKDAITGFKGISKTADAELSKVDTRFANTKSKVGGVFDSLKAAAPSILAGAAAAVGAFAVKSVTAFQNLALEAGKFSDATGIAVEDASRWIEVAGDMGVSTEAIQGAFQKMNKAIGDGKLDDFSAQIVRAKDGTVDASATFINIATTIGKIKDPTDRAAAAQKAFGKSYGEIAEIMESDANELSAALGSVSDAKVIDEGELKKARQFRAEIDELKDKSEDLSLALGEALVPVLIDLADRAQEAAGFLDELGIIDAEASGSAEKSAGIWDRLGGAIGAASEFGRRFVPGQSQIKEITDSVTQSVDANTRAYLEYQAGAIPAAQATSEVAEEVEAAGQEAKTAAGYFDDLKDKYRGLKGELDEDAAWHNLEGTMNDLRDAATEAFVAGATGADNAGDAMFDYQGDIIAAKQEVLNLMGELENIPPSVESEILVALEKNDLERAWFLLQQIRAEDGKTYRTYTVHTVTSGGPGYRPPTPPPAASGSGPRAMGGNAAGWTPVGEWGPELVRLPLGSSVRSWPQLRADMSGASGGSVNNYSISVTVAPGADTVAAGRAMVECIKDYERVNSARWRAS